MSQSQSQQQWSQSLPVSSQELMDMFDKSSQIAADASSFFLSSQQSVNSQPSSFTSQSKTQHFISSQQQQPFLGIPSSSQNSPPLVQTQLAQQTQQPVTSQLSPELFGMLTPPQMELATINYHNQNHSSSGVHYQQSKVSPTGLSSSSNESSTASSQEYSGYCDLNNNFDGKLRATNNSFTLLKKHPSPNILISRKKPYPMKSKSSKKDILDSKQARVRNFLAHLPDGKSQPYCYENNNDHEEEGNNHLVIDDGSIITQYLSKKQQQARHDKLTATKQQQLQLQQQSQIKVTVPLGSKPMNLSTKRIRTWSVSSSNYASSSTVGSYDSDMSSVDELENGDNAANTLAKMFNVPNDEPMNSPPATVPVAQKQLPQPIPAFQYMTMNQYHLECDQLVNVPLRSNDIGKNIKSPRPVSKTTQKPITSYLSQKVVPEEMIAQMKDKRERNREAAKRLRDKRRSEKCEYQGELDEWIEKVEENRKRVAELEAEIALYRGKFLPQKAKITFKEEDK